MTQLKVLITPEQIRDVKEDEYKQRILCNNCGESFIIAIKKGVMVSEEISQVPCPNCGCEL